MIWREKSNTLLWSPVQTHPWNKPLTVHHWNVGNVLVVSPFGVWAPAAVGECPLCPATSWFYILESLTGDSWLASSITIVIMSLTCTNHSCTHMHTHHPQKWIQKCANASFRFPLIFLVQNKTSAWIFSLFWLFYHFFFSALKSCLED